jgi:Fic family protein
MLAELKGVAKTIPNEEILIQSLILQEAKDSSDIENIVTTQDDLYRATLTLSGENVSPATKEVMRYGQAMRKGFNTVRHNKLLTNNVIQQIQC